MKISAESKGKLSFIQAISIVPTIILSALIEYNNRYKFVIRILFHAKFVNFTNIVSYI